MSNHTDNGFWNDVLDKINKIHQLKYDNFQSIKSLTKWPIGEQRILAGSYNTKTYEDDSMIIFKTIIPPQVFFLPHWHNVIETCEVLKGTLADVKCKSCADGGKPFILPQTLNLQEEGPFNIKYYRKGEVLTYHPMVVHIPGNASKTEPLILKVTFYKHTDNLISS